MTTDRFSASATAARASAPAAGVSRVLAANGVLQLAGMLSGQLLAFDAATHLVAPGARGAALMVALVGAAFNGMRLLAMPAAGRLSDLHGAGRMLFLSPLLGGGAVAVATAAAVAGLRGIPGAAVLVAARLVEGAAVACATPSMLTLLSRATEGQPALRTRVMGMFEISALAGLVGALLGSSLLWDRTGTRSLLVLAPVYAGAVPLLWRYAARGVRPAEQRAELAGAPPPLGLALRQALAQRPQRVFAVVWMATNAMVGLWLQYMPYLLMLGSPTHGQRMVGSLNGAGTTTVLACVGALYVGGTAAWSWLGARVSRRAMLATAAGATVVMAFELVAVNHGAPRGLHVMTAVCVALQGGITPAALALLADLTGGEDQARGTAMGLFAFLMGVGQLTGVLLGGPVVARWQLDGLLALTCVFALVALGGLAAMGARPARRSAEPSLL